MGNYTNLLSVVIDIYFSNDPNTFYDKFKSLLEKNKKLNLKTKFMCSGLNLFIVQCHPQSPLTDFDEYQGI